MPSLTLSIPPGLKRDMDEHPIINWSEVARGAIRDRLASLKILNSIAAKSRLTEKDALALGRKINRSMHERLVREHPEFYPESKTPKSGAGKRAPPHD
jgi:hypothetical protein